MNATWKFACASALALTLLLPGTVSAAPANTRTDQAQQPSKGGAGVKEQAQQGETGKSKETSPKKGSGDDRYERDGLHDDDRHDDDRYEHEHERHDDDKYDDDRFDD